MSRPAPRPVTLAAAGVQLVPMLSSHVDGLRAAAADGELWRLRITSVPEPEQTAAYIDTALAMQQAGNRLPFTVLDEAGCVIGSTSFHDILAAVERLEIGYTWYAAHCQPTTW